eukprot:Gb_11491 [translate_table: standard]
MVSEASKRKAAAKKAAAAAKRGSKSAASATASKSESSENGSVSQTTNEMASMRITDRTCTGVLVSHPQARDIHAVFKGNSYIWVLDDQSGILFVEIYLKMAPGISWRGQNLQGMKSNWRHIHVRVTGGIVFRICVEVARQYACSVSCSNAKANRGDMYSKMFWLLAFQLS